MAATATAKTSRPARSTARQAPARQRPRSRPRRRQSNTPVTGFVPVAVGAVGGLADSGLVVRLTRSRLWIGLLGGLLVGIVALNVMALQFSASSSEAARQADELKRMNSALMGDIAVSRSNDKIASAAGEQGLVAASPGDYMYLRPSDGDAAKAAERLRAGEFANAPAPVVTEPVITEPVVTEPVATEIVPTETTAVTP